MQALAGAIPSLWIITQVLEKMRPPQESFVDHGGLSFLASYN